MNYYIIGNQSDTVSRGILPAAMHDDAHLARIPLSFTIASDLVTSPPPPSTFLEKSSFLNFLWIVLDAVMALFALIHSVCSLAIDDYFVLLTGTTLPLMFFLVRASSSPLQSHTPTPRPARPLSSPQQSFASLRFNPFLLAPSLPTPSRTPELNESRSLKTSGSTQSPAPLGHVTGLRARPSKAYGDARFLAHSGSSDVPLPPIEPSHCAPDIKESPFRPPVAAESRLLAWSSPFAQSQASQEARSLPAELISRTRYVTLQALDPETRISYAAGLLRFTQFCDSWDISESARMPASSSLLVAFISQYAGFHDGPTFDLWLAGLRFWHILHHAPWFGGDDRVKLARSAATRLGSRHLSQEASEGSGVPQSSSST